MSHASGENPGLIVTIGKEQRRTILPSQEFWPLAVAVVEVTEHEQVRARGWLCDDRLATGKEWWTNPVSCDVALGGQSGRNLIRRCKWQPGMVYQLEEMWVVGNEYWIDSHGILQAKFVATTMGLPRWPGHADNDAFRKWGAIELARARSAARYRRIHTKAEHAMTNASAP